MNKIFYALIISGSLFSAGCKPEIPDVPFPTTPTISIIKDLDTKGITTSYQEFTYLVSNKIKEVKTIGPNTNKTLLTYNYIGSLIQQQTFINDKESLNEAVNYKLNDQGLVEDKLTPYYAFRLNYQYNAQGYLTTIKSFDKNTLTVFFVYHYSAGNRLDSITGYEPDSTIFNVEVFTYLPGRANTIDNGNKGYRMFGKDQAHPLTKQTVYSYNYPRYTGQRIKLFELNKTLSFDMFGRILRSTTVRTDFSYPGGNPSYFVAAASEYVYK